MSSEIKRGESILVPFRNGKSICDSQDKPRMYKTRQAFERSFPKHYLGTDGVELVEFAEVRHAYWIALGRTFPADNYTYTTSVLYMCSECRLRANNKYPYCHCGCKMDGGNNA